MAEKTYFKCQKRVKSQVPFISIRVYLLPNLNSSFASIAPDWYRRSFWVSICLIIVNSSVHNRGRPLGFYVSFSQKVKCVFDLADNWCREKGELWNCAQLRSTELGAIPVAIHRSMIKCCLGQSLTYLMKTYLRRRSVPLCMSIT